MEIEILTAESLGVRGLGSYVKAGDLVGLNRGVRIWRKELGHLSRRETEREASLRAVLGLDFLDGEGLTYGPLRFSAAVPHGDPETTDETVMMTLVEEEQRFVHAPDIQFLHDQTVSQILDWHPNILLAGGPPLYLSRLTGEAPGAVAAGEGGYHYQ